MDKQPVGQLPDLTQSNNDDEIMVITDSEHNQLKKEKISDFITDLTSTNENNALIKGTDNKLFVTDFGNADNITEGTLPVSVLPDIPKDLLPESGVTAGTYITPTNLKVNSKGQITSISEGAASGISQEDIDTVAARLLSDNACTQENFPDEFDYWYNQKYTTFNKGYISTIGTPTMSEFGVITNCGDFDYFLTPSIDVTTADSWEMRFTYTPSGTTPTTAIGLFGSNWLSVSFTTAKKIAATVNYTGGSLTLTSTGTFATDDKIFCKIRYASTGYKLYASVNPFDYGTAATNSQTAKAASAQALKLGNVSAKSYLSQGSIDMKYFEFDINGQNVQNYKQTGIDTINGTLKIPYTETTDGTKVVDAVYFDRVQSCREQTGQALYLTLDEQNQQYYLPQGTVSGMISQNKQKIDELDTTLTADILQAMPVGASIAYEGTTAPEGWFAENGLEVQKSEYPKLYAVVGDKYNLETTQEGYFRLPDTNVSSRFYEGSTTPGTLKDAGLPNIAATGTGFGVGTLAQVSGAAFSSGVNCERIQGGDHDGKRIDFQASRSNGIYGKSSTVQPKSITKFFIIKHD